MKKITFFKNALNPSLGVYSCFFLTVFLWLSVLSMNAQTVLINPNGDGGFENGSTFAANGWTTVNATTNTWNVGTVPGWFTGTGGAYVSNDSGVTWGYTNTTANRSSFYRDVTFPSGAGSVVLNFDWRGNGNDTNYDNLLVYVMDASITPTTAGPTGTNTTTTGWTGYTNGTTGYFLLQRNGTSVPTTTTNVSYTLTAAQLAYVSGSTKRLVFVWKNDGGGGVNPPASLDNVSLVAYTCSPATNVITTSFTLNSADLAWTASVSSPASGYEYELRTSGAAGSGATGLVQSGTTPAGDVDNGFTGLTANTSYTFYVRANCGSGDYSAWASRTIFTGYCVPSSTNNATYINNFSTTGGATNISNLASGYTTGGYQDNYNTLSVSQYPTGTVNFASAIVGGTVGTSIWVDWNNDLVFDNTTERVFVTTAYGNDQTGSFIVPNGTALGDYRMRVRIDFNALAPDACSNANTRTEAEDYKFTVIAAPSCLAPTGVTASANSPFTATLNWIASVTVPSNGYQYYYSTSNTSPTAGTTPLGSVGAGILTASVSGLSADTVYYVWVRSNCGTTSDWTLSPVSFRTPCDPPVITGTTPDSVCGQGVATLEAVSAGTIKWYDAATAGTLLGTGSTFNTPNITSTTSYWAEASVFGATQTSGKSAPAPAATTSTSNNWGIVFNANAPVMLQSVSVYSTAAGTINIKVTNAALTELYSTGNIAVAAGGTTTPNVIPLNFYVPAGAGYRILVKASSGISLIRDNSAVTFPYNGSDGIVNVISSEWGGTTTANYYYFYDVKYSSACISPRTEVVATVTTPPTLTLSSTSTTAVCSGQSSAPVTITAGATDYDTFVWSPSTGVTGDATSGWVFNPTATTNYVLTASQSAGSCTTTVNVAVNINPLPVVTASAANATICEGSSTTLTALTEVVAPGTITIGTGTTLTSATTQPTAFCNRWAQYWSQTVFTAAELTAAGLRAGNITSVAYGITTLGDGANVSNFTIRIGTTTNTTLSAFTTTGLSLVYGPATYAHAVGLNTISFATPYMWDGVSNIIVDIRQDGADSINNAITYYTATAGNTTVSATTSTPSTTTVLSTTNPTAVGSTQRLNVVFGGETVTTGAGTIDWLWTPGNLTGNAITVSPTTNTVYTVRGTNPVTGCFTETTVNVNVISTPAPIGTSPQTFAVDNLADATIEDIVVLGTNVVWYPTENDALANTNALAPGTQLVSGQTYYAIQTENGCRSLSALAVSVTVTLGVDSFDSASFKAYPNPVKDVLNLSYSSEISSVEVFNMLGQKVMTKALNVAQGQIDMSNLTSGNYIVKVTSEGLTKTIKVVKQ